MSKVHDSIELSAGSNIDGDDSAVPIAAIKEYLAEMSNIVKIDRANSGAGGAGDRKPQDGGDKSSAASALSLKINDIELGLCLVEKAQEDAVPKRAGSLKDQFDAAGGSEKESRVPALWDSEVSQLADGSFGVSHALNGKLVERWDVRRSLEQPGKLIVRPTEGKDPVPDNEGLSTARSELFTAVMLAPGLSAKEKLEMIRDFTMLEHRARSGELGSKLPEVRKELALVYDQLARLLTVNGSDIPAAHRMIAARQLAHELADPQGIDQGYSTDACRIAAAQCRLATVRPSVVAKVVADVLLDGKIRYGVPPVETPVDRVCRVPSSSQCMRCPKPDEERSFASQLFQLGVMNALGRDPQIVREHLYYMRKFNDGFNVPEYGRLIFKQQRDNREPGKPPTKEQNGLEVFGVTADNKEVLLRGPDNKRTDGCTNILLQAHASQRILDMLDPGRHAATVLAYSGLRTYTRTTVRDANDARGMKLFDSADHLQAIVEDAKRRGALPLIIASRDFTPGPGETEADFDYMADDENNHIIIIKDIIPAGKGPDGKPFPTALVTDDFFGRGYDRRALPKSDWGVVFGYEKRKRR